MLQFYAGLLLLAFGVTMAIMVPFIGLMFRLKFVRGKETEEVRKNASANFYKIREMHAKKAGVLMTGGGIPIILVVVIIFAGIYTIFGKSSPVSYYSLWAELLVLFFTCGGR